MGRYYPRGTALGVNVVAGMGGKRSYDRCQLLPEDVVGDHARPYEKAQRRPDANDRSIHSDRPRSAAMVRLVAHCSLPRGLSWPRR